MQVWFSRVDPKRHRFVVARPPHPPIDVTLETRSLLLHDFAHYAVEHTMGTDAGFYGLLARGRSLASLRDPDPDEAAQAELMAIERRVARLQGAFRRGGREAVGDDDAWEALRRLDGAWRKAQQGDALTVTWPALEVAPAITPFEG